MDIILKRIIEFEVKIQVKIRIFFSFEKGNELEISIHRKISQDSFKAYHTRCYPYQAGYKTTHQKVSLNKLDNYLRDLLPQFKPETKLDIQITFYSILDEKNNLLSSRLMDYLKESQKETEFDLEKLKLEVDYLAS